MYCCVYCNHFQDESGICKVCLKRETTWTPSPEEIYGSDGKEGLTHQIRKTWDQQTENKRLGMVPTPVNLTEMRRPYYRRTKSLNSS